MIVALTLTGGAAAITDENGIEQEKLVEVTVPNQGAIDALSATGADVVEYIRYNDDGTITTQVMGTDDEIQALADAGYNVGTTIWDYNDYLARIDERQAAIDASKAAQAAARTGESSGDLQAAGLRSIVFANAAPEVVIQRVDYFQNYGGRFMSVEAFDAATNYSGTAGPTLALSWAAEDGVYSTPVNMSRYIDPDPTPDTYMFHRVTIRIGAVGSTTPVPKTVRVATSTVGVAPVVAPVTEFISGNPMGQPFPIGFQSHFFDHYMDPTEVMNEFENIAGEYPNIAQLIPLPHLTQGYQRKSAAIMYPTATTLSVASAAGASAVRLASTTGVTVGTVLSIDSGANNELATVLSVITPNPASPAPNVNLTAPLTLAHASGATVFHNQGNIGSAPAAAAQPSTVVLNALKYGQDGGNATRAQFVNSGVPNSALSVSVVPNVLGEQDLIVGLATDSSGKPSSTAAQVVAAINANPAAAAVLSAQTWASNAGAGIVQPHVLANLSDFLNAPASVQRGPFQMKVLRIGKTRDGSKTGIYIYCQEHAREWVTPLTCYELAKRLTVNYATDPETKEFVDNLDIFIVPAVNPDGSHHSFYDFASQRRNLVNYCAPGTTSAMPSARNSWGVDLNRNNSEYTLFDGYFGASTSCTSDTFAGPSEVSEAETKNSHWVVDTFSNIKFSMNTHSSGGLFMWAPGSYIGAGRITAPAPNIGIEGYFWKATDITLKRIKQYRGTVVDPQTTGPIADVLYSAAGNSADDYYYRKGIIAYSFEVGADRDVMPLLNIATAAGVSDIRASTTAGMTVGSEIRIDVGKNREIRHITAIVTPNPASPATNITLDAPLSLPHVLNTQISVDGTSTGSTVGVGFMPSFAVEGQYEGMEFANGHYGLLEAALEYQRDHTAPTSSMITVPDGSPMASSSPIQATFKWGNEPSVIYYTLDGTTPTFASSKWEAQGPRRPGQIFTFDHTTTVKWLGVDIVGNTSAVQSARFAVESDAPVTTASFSPAAQNGYYRNPSITLSADDSYDLGGSGVASTEYKLDGAATWTTYSGAFQVTGDGSHTLEFRSTDLAGNVEATQSVTFLVDATGPVITITTPAVGADYLIDQAVNAAFGCTDALSGPASCSGTVANGSALDTATVGTHTFSVSASDLAGNTSSLSRNYNVHWPFTGFLRDPLKNAAPGKYVPADAGSTINIVFKLGGDRGLDILADGSPSTASVSCADYHARALKKKAKRLSRHAKVLALGDSYDDLKYNAATQEYTIKWKTDKAWKGTCRMLIVALVDNTTHTAVVKFG